MGIKETIFSALSRIAKPGAILATNTSYLDIDRIADATDRPGDVLGLHFFSPPTSCASWRWCGRRARRRMPWPRPTTSPGGSAKLPVTVGVCFGFVGNRMLARRSAAGERLLLRAPCRTRSMRQSRRSASAWALRHADLAGLDIGWRTRKATGGKAPVADALCEAGRLGQKTGKGFYLYPRAPGRARATPRSRR